MFNNPENLFREIRCSENSTDCRWQGFSFAEWFGRWSDGDHVRIDVPIGNAYDPYILLIFDILPFVADAELPDQVVIVTVGGSQVASWTFSDGGVFRKRALVVKREHVSVDGFVSVEFQIPNCRSPKSIGYSEDTRCLGIAVREITIEGLARDPGASSPLWNLGRRVGWESARSWDDRLLNGFWSKYINGPNVLDIGFLGISRAVVPIVDGAIGVDLEYPGYDGRTLPFPEGSQDAVYSSHCLEHIPDYIHAIQEWFRVIKIGGHIIVSVPNLFLYERRRRPPSKMNPDHKRFYTPSSLLAEFEAALAGNTYRVRLLEENDKYYGYDKDSATGCYEIVLVVEKIQPPLWSIEE